MNKKFLSAILFGALMVTSTGTFVSCKDYDDDIDELWDAVNGQESELKTKVTALESSISNLQSAQSSFDSKIAAAQDAAEKAALEAQKAAIAAAAEELAAVKAELQEAISANAKDAEAMKEAFAKAEEEMAKAVGRIQTLEAFKGTTETALAKLSEADSKLQAAITALDGKVAENAIQIGKNTAAINAQIEALKNYQASNDAEVKENADAIAQLISDLEALEAGQLTEAKVSEIAATVTKKLSAELDLIFAAFNKKVTHISLSESLDWNRRKGMNLVSSEALVDYTFGSSDMEGEPVVFKKGQVNTFEDQFILRVSPTNAVLDKSMIKLVDSKMNNLAGLVDIIDLEPYTGKLSNSRGVSENGLWVATVKMVNDFKMEDYKKAAYINEMNGSNGLTSYAVMVGDSLTDARQIVSEYALYLANPEKPADYVLNYLVGTDNNPWKEVADIKNRYSGNATTPTENGGTTTYEEATWNVYNHALANGTWVYDKTFLVPDWATFKSEANKTDANSKNLGNVVRAKFDMYDLCETDDDRGHSAMDVRSDKLALRVDAGVPFMINVESDVCASYVVLDEENAAESAPSELRAWEKYNIKGLNKIVKGGYHEITIPENAGADGDYIGFRVWAVNHDGTLVDPDGRAFYVYVGEENNVTATVPLTLAKVLADVDQSVHATLRTPDNQYQAFSTSAWTNAIGGKVTLDIICDGALTSETGVTLNNFVFLKANNAAVSLAGTLGNDCDEIVKVGMKSVQAAKLRDGVTYKAKLTVKGANAAVLAVAYIDFAKTLPEFPTNIAPATGMLQDGNVMIFPTMGTTNAEFDMNNAFNGLIDATHFTFNKNAVTPAALKNAIGYTSNTQTAEITTTYLNPKNADYAKKLPMAWVYDFGKISYAYDAYTQGWIADKNWTKSLNYTLQFGNYVNECTLTMDNGVKVTYPGAAGKRSAIALNKIHMTDYYGQTVDLKAVMGGSTLSGKEKDYITSAKVQFVTPNTAMPIDEFYKFENIGKAQLKADGTFDKYVIKGESYTTYKNGVATTATLKAEDCDLVIMESVKDKTTGSVASTKLRLVIKDVFGYTITKTTEVSFEMNYKQN